MLCLLAGVNYIDEAETTVVPVFIFDIPAAGVPQDLTWTGLSDRAGVTLRMCLCGVDMREPPAGLVALLPCSQGTSCCLPPLLHPNHALQGNKPAPPLMSGLWPVARAAAEPILLDGLLQAVTLKSGDVVAVRTTARPMPTYFGCFEHQMQLNPKSIHRPVLASLVQVRREGAAALQGLKQQPSGSVRARVCSGVNHTTVLV